MPLVGEHAADPFNTLGWTVAKKLAWLSVEEGVADVMDPIFILTFAPIPSIVATPEAN